LVLWVSYPALRHLRAAALDIRCLCTHRLSHIFLSEERLACQFGDLTFEPFRSAFPFPFRLCIVAVLPDDLKLS
jgi:hypothetical protein